MDDTSNWEFAAAVAAISIGLGGLLLFTIVAAIGTWRVHANAARQRDGRSFGNADDAVRELAEQAQEMARVINEATARLAALGEQVAGLSTQQALMRDRMAELMTAPPRDEQMEVQLRALSHTLDGLEDHLGRLGAAPPRDDEPEGA